MRTACLKNEVLTRSIYLLFALAGALSLVPRPSQADFFESVSSLEIKQQAFRLMEALERGDTEAYYFQIHKTPVKRIKKMVQVVNFDGDNILHFLVRLEKFDRLESLISAWRHIGTALGANRLIQALVKKNKQGISPAMEAAFSKYPERAKWAFSLPPETATALSKGLGAPETRGRAYHALHLTVAEEADLPDWRVILALTLGGGLSALSIIVASHDGSPAVSLSAAAGAVSVCALAVGRALRKREIVKTQLN